ncbi:hypothetical protein ACB092_11G120400 [Castanea dentata]
MSDEHPSKCSRIQSEEIDRDPGSRKQICEFSINKQDEIQRAYLKECPYQPKNIDYPYNDDTYRHRFQVSWFESHRGWLEYSPSMDAIYCLPCYLFGKDSNSPHKIANYQLQLKTSIECARWLAFQACAFKGHDESLDSKNKGNFIELIKFTSTFNDKVASVVLKNAPRNAKYTSPTIQKEILHILASNVRNAIREEIGDAKFCILVDEARDESKKKQMPIILRFVEKNGFIKERFFHVVHVRDTIALIQKNEICVVLSPSNMHGEWNGLQALFLKESLVTTSREVKVVHQFFDHLTNIINIVVGSSKRANQIGTLQQAGDTRWGSHFHSIFINTISEERANYKQCGDAERAYQVLTSFEFVLILHMMKEIMEITNIFCQALQQHSMDLLNAMHLVSNTKSLIQKLRDDGREPLLVSVKSFYGQHEIDIPDLNAHYTKAREHHLKIDIFTVAIDFQLQELNSRFCELTADLLTLSSTLNPKDAFRSFKVGDICNLDENYYPQDFTEQKICLLKHQLQHYELDGTKLLDFQNMGTISELCRAFSTMKLLKTRLRNRMEDELLADNMIVYIEKEIAWNFTMEIIMDEFYSMKNLRRT